MANMFTEDDDALLSELGIEVEKKKQVTRTPREEGPTGPSVHIWTF